MNALLKRYMDDVSSPSKSHQTEKSTGNSFPPSSGEYAQRPPTVSNPKLNWMAAWCKTTHKPWRADHHLAGGEFQYVWAQWNLKILSLRAGSQLFRSIFYIAALIDRDMVTGRHCVCNAGSKQGLMRHRKNAAVTKSVREGGWFSIEGENKKAQPAALKRPSGEFLMK